VKIALLKPPVGGILGLEWITCVEPLGLECVAGALEEQGHKCRIIDFRFERHSRALEKIRSFEPDVVGLQCNFTTERYRVARLARDVRLELPEALMVFGGHDVSRDPGWFLDHAGAEIVAVGDGEEIMPALVEAHGRDDDLRSVPGLVIAAKGKHLSTGPAPPRRDIDQLPLPARHLISQYANEFYINFRRPLALLETARGCPFKCNFCSVWKFHESTFREKSPERVIQELEQIEAPNVFITDDIFWMNVKRGGEMAQALKASGIKKHYNVQTRSDIICKFPQLIEAWKDCGKLTIFLGLEKIDDVGLASVNKSNTAANNDRAIEILQDLDVGYSPNFIVDPTWDREDFDKLKRWVDRTGAYNSGFSILTPLPGTDLWDEVQPDISTEDWELFDIGHAVLPTKLPLDEFYGEFAGLWQHAMDVRYRVEGKARTQLGLVLALATGKVTMSALRKGMRAGGLGALGNPEAFLKAHRESDGRLGSAAKFLSASA
jgi:radical SAM superfamily enzyme YgiQ (UPF0313 family)